MSGPPVSGREDSLHNRCRGLSAAPPGWPRAWAARDLLPSPADTQRRCSMAENTTRKDTKDTGPRPVPGNPAEEILSGGVRGEAAGCPTGLGGLGIPDPEPGWEGGAAKPEVEQLEGRQESARED